MEPTKETWLHGIRIVLGVGLNLFFQRGAVGMAARRAPLGRQDFGVL